MQEAQGDTKRDKLSVQVRRDTSGVVVAACGRLDATTAPALRTIIRRLTRRDRAQVFLELHYVHTVDVHAMEMLNAVTTRAHGVTPAVRVIQPCEALDRLRELVGETQNTGTAV